MLKKLKQTKAETLLETLVSILIAVMSVALLSSAVMASARMNAATRAADKAFAEQVAQAELYTGEKLENQKITVEFADGSRDDVTVDIYTSGNEGNGNYISYKKGGTP